MTEDADIGLLLVQPFARLIREAFSLKQDMFYSNGDPGASNDARTGKSALLEFIDVSRHSNDRCDLFELSNDVRIADVAGMENGRHTGKVLDERRIEEPMCTGNDSDPHSTPPAHGTATG